MSKELNSNEGIVDESCLNLLAFLNKDKKNYKTELT